MAQITEEDKKELKVLTEELLDISKNLLDLRTQIMTRLILLYAYECVWAVLLSMSISMKIVEMYPTYFCVANVFFYIILTLYYNFLVKLPLTHYKDKYIIGVNKLSTVVNFVDWDVFRKRQLYNDTNPDVERSIESFLMITRLIISPTNERHKRFNCYVMTTVAFRYFLIILSLYFSIMQWLQ